MAGLGTDRPTSREQSLAEQLLGQALCCEAGVANIANSHYAPVSLSRILHVRAKKSVKRFAVMCKVATFAALAMCAQRMNCNKKNEYG